MMQSRAVYSPAEILLALAISKCGRETGEKEVVMERERIHTEAWGHTLERALSSQRKPILLLGHVIC